MEQFKRVKVVMLPTKNRSGLGYSHIYNKLMWCNEQFFKDFEGILYHLYIISDDEIKEGVSILNTKTGKIEKELGKDEVKLFWEKEWKVIISSTDKSLGLPQPSQQFIEKFIECYNKGEIITDVLVEYENNKTNNFNYPNKSNKEFIDNWNLKINPKDNTITIKKLKDSWNREEVIQKLKMLDKHVKQYNHYFKGIDDFIEENL